jgi:hypothetical protein
MYRGFKIENVSLENLPLYNADISKVTRLNEQVKIELEKYLSPNGSINGDLIEKDWFPQLEFDIFISHSHADEQLAISLSKWIYNTFGLIAFVDSVVWGQSDKLLKTIDDKYSKIGNKPTYDYNIRNKSTSYVHIILTMALAKLIDKTECLFLLNTPNVSKTSDVIKSPQTHSPWLYFEMGISSLLSKPLSTHRHKILTKSFSKLEILTESKKLDVSLPLTDKHLTNIDGGDLVKWEKSFQIETRNNEHPLNKLYKLFPAKNENK